MNSPDFDQRAAEALGAARFHIDKLAEAAHPGENESVAIRDNDPYRWDAARFDRMIEVCGTAHMATENAIKAFTAGVARQLPRLEHRIEKLLDKLPVLASQEFEGLISPLAPEDLNPWRAAATYVYEEESLETLAQITPEYAANLYNAALASCEHVASKIIARHGVGSGLGRIATSLSESVTRARNADYVNTVRDQPQFAASTYTARGMTAHPRALQDPAMPSRSTPLRTLWRTISRRLKLRESPLSQRQPSSRRAASTSSLGETTQRSSGPPQLCGHPIGRNRRCSHPKPALGKPCAAGHINRG